MNHLSMNSPIGSLTIFEDDGKILALEWGRAPKDDGSKFLMKAKKQVDDFFSAKRKYFSLPLNPIGTPFQMSVWALLREIPYGRPCTYGDLSKTLRSSPRAVGGACGRNPIPIIIPCHRVIGANGEITGYSAGAGIIDKRFLLNLEKS